MLHRVLYPQVHDNGFKKKKRGLMAPIAHIILYIIDSPLGGWELNTWIDGDVTLVQGYSNEVD